MQNYSETVILAVITFNSSSWIRNRRVSAAIGDIFAIFSSALGSQERMDYKVKGDLFLCLVT